MAEYIEALVVSSFGAIEVRKIYSEEDGKTFKIIGNNKKERLVDIISSREIDNLEISGFTVIGDDADPDRYDNNGFRDIPVIRKLSIEGVSQIKCPFFRKSNVLEIDLHNCKCKEVKSKCFSDCPILEKVSLPESCEFIESSAFCNTPKLSSVSGLDSVKRIAFSAFGCTGLEVLDLSASDMLESIDNPFGDNSKGKVKLSFDCCAQIYGNFEINSDMTITYTATAKPKSSPVSIAGKTFILTGKMWTTRATIEHLIMAAGGYISSKVSSSSDYLVSTRTDTGKYKAAIRMGAHIITEEDLRNSLK